jgi:4-hydroxy-4-methyl-2-oxoglutarate aldolase
MGHYDVAPMPARAGEDLLELLEQVETATLGHWRLWGVCSSRLRAVSPGKRVAGVAVTLMLPGIDSTLLHHAVDQLRDGDILFIDRGGECRYACVGGIVALAAKQRRAKALVLDGPVTDIEEVRAVGISVWCDGISALTTRGIDSGGRMNFPVSVGGTVVNPGDLAVCDDNGIVILAPGEARMEAQRAIQRQKEEGELSRRVRAGELLSSLTGANERVIARDHG